MTLCGKNRLRRRTWVAGASRIPLKYFLWATKARKGGKERYISNYEDMKDENGGKQMKNVWRIMPPGSQEKQFGKHPTQKPVSLIARCLRASTDAGDLIVDPFVGSGTTGVAALQLGRNFQGCEREEQYIRLAAKRLSQVTGSPSHDIWPLKAGARG